MFAPFLFALLQTVSPATGDTVGYWQQRANYTVVATLDESQNKLHARGTLMYVNNSPDTLREMFFHQYLNAFRPGSKWSAADEREHRVRFQRLSDPDYGYERFTVPPVVNGTPVTVDYPGAPDSTVVHFKLPIPLAPHDSIRIAFEWDARPSTVPRRQGRRGRTFDFAQWYPKVAVYDRNGWEPNPLRPAGELYGEFGTFDVTMIVAADQVLASTGVPVSGDPGWARVSRTGAPYLASNAYGGIPVVPTPELQESQRAVRFIAENVHHFAWSASPDYRYEGGVYVRPIARTHFQTWDSVAVHVLFKPGDDTTWGGGRAVERTIAAAKWLESVWGPYAYPQITNVHRLDGGGTEFPMMVMDGSASQGLILHEFGHVFTYGILANNEWRSGWLDEGLTDFQTDWAQRLTAPEQIGRSPIPARLAEGYRVNAAAIAPVDTRDLDLVELELLEQSQPIGLAAFEFRDFGVYNTMIYSRAKLMYSQMRDVMGDSMFTQFMHDYYDRWALKHVDELAIRAAAERAYGRSLGWFFDQWVHRTGLMDYALGAVRVNTDGARYETIARVSQRGDLKHPMIVGVQTASGWTIARADALQPTQDVHIVTTERPLRVELDPHHVTWDWDRRNNIQSGFLISVREPRLMFNWPWLDQTDRSHTVVALSPHAWFTNPQGPIVGLRAKTNYLGLVDIHDGGFAFAARNPHNPVGANPSFVSRIQFWARAENLYLNGFDRPLMGTGAAFNFLDGILKLDGFHDWDLSPFSLVPSSTIKARAYVTTVVPTSQMMLPEQWSKANVAELGGKLDFKSVVDADSTYVVGRLDAGFGFTASNPAASGEATRGYARASGSAGIVLPVPATTAQIHARLFGGIARNTPRQRAIFASSADPFETFTNDLFRGRGALLKQDGVNYLPIGGAGMRGYNVNMPLDAVIAMNGEVIQGVGSARGAWGRASVSLVAFSDVGLASSKIVSLGEALMTDAGVGIQVRGRFYDRNISLRVDAPVFVNQAGFAGWKLFNGRNGSVAPRLMLTTGELW